MSDYDVRLLEQNAKRLTKPKLVEYAARLLAQKDKEARDIAQHSIDVGKERAQHSIDVGKERDALKQELTSLKRIRDVLAVTMKRKSRVTDAQLALILGKDRDDLGGDKPETILCKLLDNIDTFLDEFGGGAGAPTYDDLQNALDTLRADREALLKRLGLTDREWSAMGGACDADLEP